MLKPIQSVRISRDAGLQVERTMLAWNRTLFLVAINGLLLLRMGWGAANYLSLMPGIAFLILLVITKSYFYFNRAHFITTDPRRISGYLSFFTLLIVIVSISVIANIVIK